MTLAFATFVPDESGRQVLKRWGSAVGGPPHLALPDLEGGGGWAPALAYYSQWNAMRLASNRPPGLMAST